MYQTSDFYNASAKQVAKIDKGRIEKARTAKPKHKKTKPTVQHKISEVYFRATIFGNKQVNS